MHVGCVLTDELIAALAASTDVGGKTKGGKGKGKGKGKGGAKGKGRDAKQKGGVRSEGESQGKDGKGGAVGRGGGRGIVDCTASR